MDTRQRILDAAHDLLLLREPGADFSLRAVARRVGLSPMAIYRHFEDLEHLQAALREAGHLRLMGLLQRALLADSARERLHAFAFAYLEFALAEPATYDLMFSSTPTREDLAQQALRRSNATFRILHDRIRDACAEAAAPPASTESTTLDVWAGLHGLLLLQRDGRLGLPPERFLPFALGFVDRYLPPP